ncbi:MAG TPA: ribosome recycling factor [Clostridiaceae bacterium]|nr:ribosome recycling factor [Clostridiaceae bacterium]
MDYKQNLKPFEEKMVKTLSVLDGDFNTIRAGRANPRLLDQITIDYYGVETPINQVANIQVPEARMIVVTPWDPSALRDLERALQMSDLGIPPNNDGKNLRLIFPPLTEDRRRELTRQVGKMGEEAKVAVRNIRREAIESFKTKLKQKEISEDVYYDIEDEIQKLTDRYVEKVDEAVSVKDKELMEI